MVYGDFCSASTALWVLAALFAIATVAFTVYLGMSKH